MQRPRADRRARRRSRPGGTVQHGAHGACGSPSAANGVSVLHGRGQPDDVRRHVSQAFDTATEVPITSVTNGVHGPTWMAPGDGRTAGQVVRRHPPAPNPQPPLGGRGVQSRPATCGQMGDAGCGPSSSRTCAAGCTSRAWSAECPRESFGWTAKVFRPGRAHHRLRPPGPVSTSG